MPPKRRAVESDDESSSTPSSKRARTDPNTDDEEAPAPGPSRHRSAHSDEESDGDEDDEEREFEARYGPSIRASYEKKQKSAGGIAEAGIIEHVELRQFMCHHLLRFSFGPQLNFIIGHNGSGKSAILTAITVALGGRAAATGRGQGLKSFIREGQSAAEVTITLKNQGEEAYRPQEYGKSIIITRRFTKEGNSSWKIKGKDGHVVSTKKEELSAICDHMNIQIDNPLTVLTQDSARSFLGSSSAADKYKFFLRGTQLSQLSEEYGACLNNVSATFRILMQKKEAIPELKNKLSEVSARFKEATRARDLAHRADALTIENAWALVNGKQAEVEKNAEELADLEHHRLPKVQEALEKAQNDLERINEVVAALEKEHNAVDNRDHLRKAKNEIATKIRLNADEHRAWAEEMRQIDDELKSVEKEITEFEKEIAKEMKRLEADTESARHAVQQEIIAAREQQAAAEQQFEQVTEEIATTERQLGQWKQQGDEAERRGNDLRGQIMRCDAAIQSCEKAERDRYLPFGSNIQQVIKRIEQTRWHGRQPLGPLGVFVRLRPEATEYRDVLRNQLAQQLMSFAVTDARDQGILKKILADAGNSRTVIHKFSPDLFDYQHGEPPEDVLTVLRALEIDDPHVLRILINRLGIESRVLAPTRKEAEQILRRLGGQGYAWSKDGFNLTRFSEGGESSVPSSNSNANPMLLADQAAVEIEKYRTEKQQHEAAYRTVKNEVNDVKQQWATRRRELETLKAQQHEAGERKHKAKNRARQLEDQLNVDMPLQLGAIRDELETARERKKTVLAQAEEVTLKKGGIDAEKAQLAAEREKVQREIDEFDSVKEASKAKIMAEVDKRSKLNNSVEHYQKKLTEEQIKIDAAKLKADQLELDFATWTEKAETIGPRVETNRTVEAIQRESNRVLAALKDRESRDGATVEEMVIEVNKAQDMYTRAQQDYKQMNELNIALKLSLIDRLARLEEFRKIIALRTGIIFGLNMSMRGYYGKVVFNHEKQTLDLRVQTDDQAATQGHRKKNTKNLSGGEKSFATICLLLSLWESIGSPIRCLDEFDVFMDAVNRRISMGMMTAVADRSDKKQYILITPQDMQGINPGPTVRIQRMSDPERSQGILYGGQSG
ncbi:p-loop containing nucleoside triphosphate hydrolase protein [Mycena chlorophos]|uniref:p-loop containing nucleoside triphosphate hydrolase protein n=1 Tax=Mycena chlorophos TaxID=658473 RepID=A0A8H6SJ06_MYCCL|nr:p-loop containing nucleoside triphosphate hydrolase protein [Mycena chlorophos]